MTANGSGLLEALLAVQAEAPTLLKDHKATVKSDKGSYTYSYVALDTVVEKVGPILNKHGLVWITKPGADEHGQPVLNYTLAHAASGEREEGAMPLLLTKSDPQGQGSAITYARRYCLCAVLNLVADDDDDGAGASRPGGGGSVERPSPAQLKFLKSLVTQNKPPVRTMSAMFARVGAEGLEFKTGWTDQITKQQASELIEIFKSGTLPDPDAQDLPADDPPEVPPVGDDGDLPFDVEMS